MADTQIKGDSPQDGTVMVSRKTDREISALIEQVGQLADRLKIKKLVVVCESATLWPILEASFAQRQWIIVVPKKRIARNIPVETCVCDFTEVARSDRIDYVMRALTEASRVKKAERVICLSSLGGRKLLDTVRIIRIEEQYGPISPHDLRRIGRNMSVDLLFLVINLAVEIGQEGREGMPVGTIFVVGDTDNVLQLSKSMIFNPFLGYSEDDRNIFDEKVQESIKELATIDGAFIIRDDGVVEAGGQFLHAGADKATTLIKGLGARHAASAAISANTEAVAVTVSESTGTVRIFSGGKSVRTIRSYRPKMRVLKRSS